MRDAVLVIDADRSNIRFGLFTQAATGVVGRALGGGLTHLLQNARFRASDAAGRLLTDVDCADEVAPGHGVAIEFLFNWLTAHAADLGVRAIGHRLADDDGLFDGAVRTDASVVARLDAVETADPVDRARLAVVRLLADRTPRLPQIVCFDRSFHALVPSVARAFDALQAPDPRLLYRHGLAYEDLIDELAALDARAVRGRTIAVHVANTVAVCAIAAGRSIAATSDLSRRRGSAGGTSNGAHRARVDPFELRRYRLAREIGSLAAALGGLDTLALGAEGRASLPLVQDVLRAAAWLGVEAAAEPAAGSRLSDPQSQVAAYLVPVDPARAVARHAFAMIAR